MFEDNISVIKLCWVMGLAPSPVSQSAKHFKIIGPGMEKKNKNKKMGNFSAA